MIHKIPTLRNYNHPSCKYRGHYSAMHQGMLTRLSKAFGHKADAQAFLDLKMNEYKVFNILSVNELASMLPAINKWIKFVNEHPETVSIEDLETVVVNEIILRKERLASQKLTVIIQLFLDEKILAYQQKHKTRTDIGSNCRNLRSRLKTFQQYTHQVFDNKDIFISEFTLKDAKNFKSWLYEEGKKDGGGYGIQSVINHLLSVSYLFNYSVKNEYLTRNVFNLFDFPKAEDRDIKYYSLQEMEYIWRNSCPPIRLAIFLQAFCGVRVCEYKRLRWSDLQHESNQIKIRGGVGKSGRKRNIPITDTHSQVLQKLIELNTTSPKLIEDDPISLFDNLDDLTTDSSEDDDMKSFINELVQADFDDKSKVFNLNDAEYYKLLNELTDNKIDNGFRHSFGTYHYALLDDSTLTTKMMGNSQQVLEKHYDGLGSNKKEAENYFNIMTDFEEVDQVQEVYTTEPIDPELYDVLPEVNYDQLINQQKEELVERSPYNRRIHKDL